MNRGKEQGIAINWTYPLLLPFIHEPGQADDLGADAFEVGVEAEGAAEGFERGDGIFEFEVGLAHAGGGDEVVGIEFEGFVAIADGVGEAAEREEGDGALVPGFGEPGGLFGELGRAADHFLELPGVVEAGDNGDFAAVFSLPIRHQIERRPFSARVRTLRSSSSIARPSV